MAMGGSSDTEAFSLPKSCVEQSLIDFEIRVAAMQSMSTDDFAGSFVWSDMDDAEQVKNYHDYQHIGLQHSSDLHKKKSWLKGNTKDREGKEKFVLSRNRHDRPSSINWNRTVIVVTHQIDANEQYPINLLRNLAM